MHLPIIHANKNQKNYSVFNFLFSNTTGSAPLFRIPVWSTYNIICILLIKSLTLKSIMNH